MIKPFKRKRIIEVYFVLYLMAIILILPPQKIDNIDREGAKTMNVYQFPFSLKPVNTVLNAKILYNNDSLQLISLDSINTIYYTGDIEDIEFEFMVNDLSINQELLLNTRNKTKTKLFSISEDKKRQAAIFKWTPQLNHPQDRTYLVKVKAKIKPKFDAENPNSQDIITINTEFSINVDFVSKNEFADITLYQDSTDIQDLQNTITRYINQNPAVNTGDLFILPGKPVISTLAGESWINELLINGIDISNELKTAPKISIAHSDEGNGGIAKLTVMKDNSLVIEGIAPDYGSNKVTVTLTRIDGKQSQTSFNVLLESIGNPILPKTMLPEIKYTLDPQLPALSSQNSYSLLINSSGKELDKQIGGRKFIYSPSWNDTGTYVYIERYLNNRRYDRSSKSTIIANPKPKILYVQKISEKKVKISTFSEGIFRGRENIVDKLIIEGNASYYPLSGEMRSKNNSYEQFFILTPKNKSKTFSFKVRAVNIQGHKSIKNQFPK